MGETKIAWLKSCSRSATSEMMPIADDCQTDCARTPVKTKSRRLMPARSPKPACNPVPRMPMKMSGNEKSAMIRWRSRSSLIKSRCARTRIPDASVIRPAHDLEVGVLEARRVGLHHRERRLDGTQERVDAVPVELDPERRIRARDVPEAGQLLAQAGPVLRIDQHVLLDQIALDVVGRAVRDDAPVVEDADAIRLLGLLQVVRREEDRRPAR